MNQCLALFLQFCKFSVLCFGGGYMLIPLLTAEFVEPDHVSAESELAGPAAIVRTVSGDGEQVPAEIGPESGAGGASVQVSSGEASSGEASSGGAAGEIGSVVPESGVPRSAGRGRTGKVLTESEFGNLVSVAQVTPGPVGLNTATYVGYVEFGFFGSLAASLGLIAPTVLIGCFAAAGVNRWKDTFLVKGMLKGTRLAAVALIMYAVTIFFGMSIFTRTIPWEALGAVFRLERPVLPAGFGVSLPGVLICGAVVFLTLKTKLPTTVLLLGSAAAGAVFAALIG